MKHYILRPRHEPPVRFVRSNGFLAINDDGLAYYCETNGYATHANSSRIADRIPTGESAEDIRRAARKWWRMKR